jgi:hypothetical protein
MSGLHGWNLNLSLSGSRVMAVSTILVPEEYVVWVFILFSYAMLGMEPRASCMLGKHSCIEIHPQL